MATFDLIVGDCETPAAKVPMIPPGYDDHPFFPVSEASRAAIRQRLSFAGKVILALGRLARNKGYDLLIDAFAVTASRVPDAVLPVPDGRHEAQRGRPMAITNAPVTIPTAISICTSARATADEIPALIGRMTVAVTRCGAGRTSRPRRCHRTASFRIPTAVSRSCRLNSALASPRVP